ncbi:MULTISPECIES: type II toxin-antitoxin system RelE family toxin [Acetobacter]|uniref:mRNA interferase RelE n=1 Tax=Acetobacter ascendens TaxID=481146 RepID=A0A1Y0V889_9PROT|nr:MULTISPECIES: type II toxin-antitoxin system RelE/ParE family toxin [Acetobacter]ARW12099.1 mRNA interferase RelE [Acetobacter ascendens]KAA8383879.1 type II toxin-antitoxin system RelE/ParE family toxin [Acetobacter sp. DmW_136]
MSRYALHFDPRAKREWDSLDGSIKILLKKALAKRLDEPHVSSAELSGDLRNCYKIKLRSSGYRLVYQMDDGKLIVLVIAIGRRDAYEVYGDANCRA